MAAGADELVLTTFEGKEKRLADLVLSLLELVHEHDAPLATVADEVIVHRRTLLPALIWRPWAEEIRLKIEMSAVNGLEGRAEEPAQISGYLCFSMTTGTGKKKHKRSTCGH
jgi:hypothetical protein